MDVKQEFAKLLRGILFEKKITQRDLANMTGISEVTISRIANGHRMCKLNQLIRIADALGVDTCRLVPKMNGVLERGNDDD